MNRREFHAKALVYGAFAALVFYILYPYLPT